MNLYFDLENVKSFISDRDKDRYPDCLRLMQKQLDTYFNFKKEDIAENEGLTAWFKFFTQGVGKDSKQIFNEINFPERPIKSNTHVSLNPMQLSSVFLIDDERIDICIDAGVLLIGKPGDEVRLLSVLFLNQDDYSFDKKFRIGGSDFINWSDLQTYSFPISDILIVDPFILDDQSLIDSNIISYLKVLTIKSKSKLNIIIYTHRDKVRISYSEISRKVRACISSITGKSPNFTLITYIDQRGTTSFAEHDRTIFTNYFRVYSGDSFNYFHSNGSILTKGREIHYSGFGKKENHLLSLELINDIQKNIDEMSVNAIEGDKKSNILYFS